MKHSRLGTKELAAGLCSLGLLLSLSTAIGEETSLREQLLKRASGSKMPAEAKAKMTQHLKEVTDSDLVSKARKNGDKAPDFKLKDHLGKEHSLSEFLAEGPVVLTWYRGGW